MPRTIGFLGSVALLVSGMTGPSLVVIPLLFQQAGWFTPLLFFTIIGLLTGSAALLIVESMSTIEGNEGFEASIEFTTVAYRFLGRRWHFGIQGFLFLAMQSLVIASLLEIFQSMDAFLISVAHKSCAVSFTDGWVCVNQIPPNAPSAFSGYILGSLGTLIALCLIVPLSLIRLSDNIIFQLVAFMLLLVITIIWLVIFAVKGVDLSSIPAVGSDQSSVVGFVLSNFSFVMIIPAWVNETHPSVNIRLAVWVSVLIACLIYVPIGWMGGAAFCILDSETLLDVLVTSTGHGTLSAVAQVSTYMFPLAVLVTSVPVFTIVMRYNLLRGDMCSNKMAIFWSTVLPWLIAIPLQTNDGLPTMLNWASLIFASPCNLLVPFVLFIASKRYSASASLAAKGMEDPEMSFESAGAKTIMDNTPPLCRVDTNLTVVEYDNPEEMKRAYDSEKVAFPQSMDRISSPSLPALIRVDSNSTVVDRDSTEEMRMKKVLSEESGIAVQTTLDMSSPPRDGYYAQQVLREGGKQFAGAGGTDLPGIYLAFPFLSSTQSIRSTHISGIGFFLSSAIILIGIVYGILRAVKPGN